MLVNICSLSYLEKCFSFNVFRGKITKEKRRFSHSEKYFHAKQKSVCWYQQTLFGSSQTIKWHEPIDQSA